MELLLERQNAIIKDFEKIHINFKKHSKDRKTSEYFVKKLELLDNLWDEFQQNHQNLEAREDKSSQYFTENIYTQVSRFFTAVRQTISSASKDLSSKSGGTSFVFEVPKITESQIRADELLAQQQANFRALERQIARITVENVSEKWEIEDELQNLLFRWRIIDEIHLRIDGILSGTNVKYDEKFTEMEIKYNDVKRKLNKKLSSTAHLQQSIPQIEIPIFTGKYTQWPTFCDLYTEAIHNNKYLSNAQKMQHLKGKVRGEAERIIQHLHITADNYETAWEILNHRYNNPQLLFTKQVDILLNQPASHKPTSYDLKKLYDTTTECIHAIHNLGVNTNSWDPLLVHLLCKKLDPVTYNDYKEYRKQPRELPSLDEFMTFIETKFIALEPVHRREREPSSVNKPSNYENIKSSSPNSKPGYRQVYQQEPYRKGFYQATPAFARKSCIACKDAHDLFMCKSFINLSAKEQMEFISKHKICVNCLYKHYDKPCNSTRRCKECNENHNTLIHNSITRLNMTNIPTISSSSAPTTSSSTSYRQHQANYVSTEDGEILLTTVSIQVKSTDGRYITLKALLDQGSQVSIISEKAAQLLGLRRQKFYASVSGIGPSFKQSKSMVTLECRSIYQDYNFITEALVISRVINNLPNLSFTKRLWPHIQHLQLADPDYNVSRPIDLLLDAGVYSDIIMEGLIKGPAQAPIAQQTRLGWILSGNVRTFKCNVVINEVQDLSKYWEIEDIQSSPDTTLLSEEEKFCEELYQKTTRRLENGSYEVAIPMKVDFQKYLGKSKSVAIEQFLQLEKKFNKNQLLYDEYRQIINEYLHLGHIRKVNKRVNETACYLPHHGVMKLDSTTTALRVVFNASAKTSTGYSLNDLMERGPNLQLDLQSLILRWRLYRYVLTADIEKMYRQIYVRDIDQRLQSIIWRDSPQEPLNEYHLSTVTFGMKASPFLAMRTLKQIAKDNQKQYPMGSKALESSFYMDDLMCGYDCIDEAKQLQYELITILNKAGMNLRKWSSNEPKLIQHLSPEQLSTMYDFKDSETRKTLGLKWNPTTDMFTYNFKLENNQSIQNTTKRQLLSDISKIYDPLGWLSPITIRGKILFQQTWLSNLSWDDHLPNAILQDWKQLKEDLLTIGTFEIPRYLGQSGHSLELHGFCDASEKAYACAIYLVTKNNKGEYTSRLVAAKTKVTPTKKQISLARLELLGSVLLSILMNKVKETFSLRNTTVYAWTDSMIVLGWLHGDISKWKSFVANRVRQIIDIIPAKQWQHIRSEENAADCATRGMSSINLINHSLWWEGPKCILNYQPSSHHSYREPYIETKKIKSVNSVLQSYASSFIIELLNKMSSITKVAKTIAWVLHFIACLRKQFTRCTMNSIDLQCAYNLLIKTIQYIEFEDNINHLKRKGHVRSSSKLSNLSPYLDENGLLRVGGRLENTNLSFAAKHPIILPTNSRLTELIIDQAHITTLHGGPRLTLSYIRDTYWIISGIRSVKKQLRYCIKCRRYKQEVRQQIMADLPSPRVTPARPFTNTGVDFTGHIDVKQNKGRGVRTSKGYVAVFVCLATKAVHLELVSDMSSETFLAAFRRMCARRGIPKNMYSDNGTNFIGAARFLEKEYKEIIKIIQTDVMNHMGQMGITWHFNAPAWPTANGLFEAAVKSMKYHLKRTLGEQKLTYEELTTLLQQIEACLNSRPLIPLNESPDDIFLTPGHFLIGGPLLSRPQTEPESILLSSRWRMVQAMNKQIWKKWSSEYLHQLQIRSKWRQPTKDIDVNDIVLIKEENMPPGKWAMGRVCELHPGKDGHTRVVSLKTQNNILKRPITKLVSLPIDKREKLTQNPEDPQQPNMEPNLRTTTRQRRTRRSPFKNIFFTTLFLLMSINTI